MAITDDSARWDHETKRTQYEWKFYHRAVCVGSKSVEYAKNGEAIFAYSQTEPQEAANQRPYGGINMFPGDMDTVMDDVLSRAEMDFLSHEGSYADQFDDE